MFEIEYKGGNTIILSTKKSTLVVDPKLSAVGLKDIVKKDAIELATEERFAINSEDAKLSIEGPGDYEVSDFSIHGVATVRHIDGDEATPIGTIYSVEVDGVRVAIVGNSVPKLNEMQLEEIGVVDGLIIPVGGGGYTLDATSASALVRQIEPKFVVPVHYADSTLTYEVSQDDVEVFIKELAAPLESPGTKYKVKNLPATLTVVQIERS